MRVLVTGSRSWDRQDVIEACLDIIAAEAAAEGVERLVVVHGCAQGADMFADRWTRRPGHPLEVRAERHPADWTKGKGAGHARNRRMIQAGADVCLAFIRDASSGATRCAEWAERAGIHVERLEYGSLPERVT